MHVQPDNANEKPITVAGIFVPEAFTEEQVSDAILRLTPGATEATRVTVESLVQPNYKAMFEIAQLQMRTNTQKYETLTGENTRLILELTKVKADASDARVERDNAVRSYENLSAVTQDQSLRIAQAVELRDDLLDVIDELRDRIREGDVTGPLEMRHTAIELERLVLAINDPAAYAELGGFNAVDDEVVSLADFLKPVDRT